MWTMGRVRQSLYVKTGNLSLPGKIIPFWGLSTFNKPPIIPGPKIEAIVGDIIKVRLFNRFWNSTPAGESVSLIFPGQENVMVKKWFYRRWRPVQPQYSEGKIVSFTNYLKPWEIGIVYRFRANRPGIYLYESGTRPEKQKQMGIFGVLEIRPRGYNIPSHRNYKTAYGANTGSDYDVKKVLILGEIDSALHENVVSDENYDNLNYKPDWWTINGRSYPDTLNEDDTSSQPSGSQITCKVGERVLVRIINAGFKSHTFYFGGMVGRVVAEDSFPLMNSRMDATYEKAGVTLGAGQSTDVILTPTSPGEYFLFDRGYNYLVNDDQFPGGMMTKLKVLN